MRPEAYKDALRDELERHAEAFEAEEAKKDAIGYVESNKNISALVHLEVGERFITAVRIKESRQIDGGWYVLKPPSIDEQRILDIAMLDQIGEVEKDHRDWYFRFKSFEESR